MKRPNTSFPAPIASGRGQTAWRLRLAAVGGSLLLGAGGAAAAPTANFCSSTADTLLESCKFEVRQDRLLNQAKCINVSDRAERADCQADTSSTAAEDSATCDASHTARLSICGRVGEARYDPPIDPAKFVDPMAIGTSVTPNPFLILTPGFTRIYHSGSEVGTVEVTRKTRLIDGVTCVVIHDFSKRGHLLTEDTEDYMAQDVDGNVWYFGELSQSFKGRRINSLGGSFLAGQHRDKPGIVMLAAPTVGTLYREEFSLANAEDVAEVVSVTATESSPAVSCNATCLETHNTEPPEPDTLEHKFYAPGVGEIVSFDEDDPESREVLVEFHF